MVELRIKEGVADQLLRFLYSRRYGTHPLHAGGSRNDEQIRRGNIRILRSSTRTRSLYHRQWDILGVRTLYAIIRGHRECSKPRLGSSWPLLSLPTGRSS